MQQYWGKMKFSLLILLTILATGCTAKTMSEEQIFLEIELKSEHAEYYVVFNDINIFTEASGKPVNFKLPLNHWVLNGKNTLRIGVDFGEGGKLKAASAMDFIANINMRIKTDTQTTTRPISQFMISSSKEQPDIIASNSSGARRLNSDNLFLPDEKGDVSVGDWKRTEEGTWIDFDQTIELNLGYPEWAYLDADYLGDADAMTDEEFFALQDEVHAAYTEIWQLMKDKNKTELLKRFTLRASEYDKAFHLAPGEKLSDMEHSLTTAFNHESLVIDDMYPSDYSQLSLRAGGKVALLRAASSNEPIISYSHPKGAYHRTYDMYFMRKNGKWIVIR